MLVTLTLAAAGSGAAITRGVRPATAAVPPSYVVYGDSLMVESTSAMRQRLTTMLPGYNIVIRATAGTTLCDWQAQMQADAASLDIKGVTMAFWGNYATDCITRRDFVQGTADDANWAVSFWRGRSVPVMFVGVPGRVGYAPGDRQVWGVGGANIYAYVAGTRNVAFVDPNNYYLDGPTNSYVAARPCLIGECFGMATVRSDDGIHFCSTLYGSTCTTEYASGITRYVEGIVHGVATILGLPQPPWRQLVDPYATLSCSQSSSSTSAITVRCNTTAKNFLVSTDNGITYCPLTPPQAGPTLTVSRRSGAKCPGSPLSRGTSYLMTIKAVLDTGTYGPSPTFSARTST